MRAASSRLRRVRSAGPAFCSVCETSITSSALPIAIAERLIHIGDQRLHLLIEAAADADHRLRQTPRIHLLLHERAVADFHVEHQRVDAFGHLLRHDGRSDQRNRFHRARHVAQRIEALIGRRDFFGLPDEAQAQLRQLRAKLIEREIGAKTGNRFQLVERAAGVAQAAAGNHRHHHARRRRNGRADQAGLIAHAAGRMLIDLDARNVGKDQRLPGAIMHFGERAQFAIRHATEKRGHEERGHLIVGNLTGGVPVHQELDFFHTKLFTPAFPQDQVNCAHDKASVYHPTH